MAEITPDSIDVDSEKNANGKVTVARIRFGPHYLVEVRKDRGKVSCVLVATHHGFKADASEVSGELERIIEEVRRAHPDAIVD
jgi:type IV secretory pathway TrbF-like protein